MQKYFSTLIRLWILLKPFHKDFYIQLGSIVTQQAIGIGITYILAKTLDSLVSTNIPTLIWMIILYPLLSIIRIRIGYYTEQHSLRRIDGEIQQYLEEFSFKKIFTLTISQYREDHSAIKLQVINRGENAVETIVSTLVLTFLPTIIQILFAITAISFYSITVALWSLCTVIGMVIWTNHFANYHRPFIKKNIENWDTQRKVRTEAFQHLSLIKLLASEMGYLKKYLSRRLELIKYNTFTGELSITHNHRRGIFLILSRTVTFIIIIQLFLKSLLTIGAIYALWTWINEVYASIQNIVQTLRQIPLRFVELDKYLEIIDREPTFKEGGTHGFTTGDLVFKNLSFKYPLGEDYILKDYNLTIEKGKITAFVGHSGSGKSTIIGLLLRIYDWDAGDITINNTSLRTMDAKKLREHIGYVEQHVDLLDDTIKENILLGVQEYTRTLAENNLEAIAHMARIDQFYHRLGEKKFDTVVGERGIKLSGGERQRIGIARAIIKNPEILIFDEATSSLDTENEKYVMEAIHAVSKGKTTIIIAHRLSTVRHADKIVVMDKGRIVGEGTHAELMHNNEVYQNLVTHQLS